MAKKIEINGIGLAYEVFGSGNRTVVITPGGRYSKDTPGVPELAEQIAKGGYKVLIWDRPNAGEADISFAGDSDARLSVDALIGLLKALDFGPSLLIGGSAGSRQSLLTTLRFPQQVKGLFIFWTSGGAVGLAYAAMYYCGVSALAAARGGMEAVAELPVYAESLERNPGNRDRLLKQNPKEFIAKMQAWTAAFFPQHGSPVPGYTPADLAGIKVPTMIMRGDEMDLYHPGSVCEELHRLIPGSQLVDPAWGPNSWAERVVARETRGETLFARMPVLAPQILEFFSTIK